MGAALVLAWRSDSRRILGAAIAIAACWGASALARPGLDADRFYLLSGALDACLAGYFLLAASAGRVFPLPLFLIYALSTAYQAWPSALGVATVFGVGIVVNRLFELSLLYIIGASVYRIRRLKARRAARRPWGPHAPLVAAAPSIRC